MEITAALVGTVIGSATFGAIVGKFLDAFLISKINQNIEKSKWLREMKLIEFSKLSQELSSMGFDNKTMKDEYKFYSLASKSLLLLDDKTLKKEIQDFIEEYTTFIKYDYPKIMAYNNQTYNTLGNGAVVGEKEAVAGQVLLEYQSKAFVIINKLSKNLADT